MAAIVFDLDGTLIDSAPDIHAAANRMLIAEGLEVLDLQTITSFIGNGLPKLVERVMRARDMDMDRHGELAQVVLDFYNQASSDLTVSYPGLLGALEALKADGHAMGVCTNKPAAPARDILRALNLERFFEVVVGGDSTPVKKPDPKPLLVAFEALGQNRKIYVGDSEIDAETAERASIDFALFTEGYRKVEVDEMTYRATFNHFAQLPEITAEILNT